MIGAAICHRAQAFKLTSGHWEEAAEPLVCRTEWITGEIHRPDSKPRLAALGSQAFCFPVAICCYICLIGVKQPIAHQPNLLLNDTLNMNAAASSKFHYHIILLDKG